MALLWGIKKDNIRLMIHISIFRWSQPQANSFISLLRLLLLASIAIEFDTLKHLKRAVLLKYDVDYFITGNEKVKGFFFFVLEDSKYQDNVIPYWFLIASSRSTNKFMSGRYNPFVLSDKSFFPVKDVIPDVIFGPVLSFHMFLSK